MITTRRRDAHTSLTRLLIAAGMLVVVVGGCAESDPGATTVRGAAPIDTRDDATPGFESPEAALAAVLAIGGIEARDTLLDMVYPRNQAETYLVRWDRSVTRARLDYAAAMSEHFGDAAAPLIDTDLGMTALLDALRGATFVSRTARIATLAYTNESGEPVEVPVRKEAGKWRLPVHLIDGGQEMTDLRFASRQFRYMGSKKYHREVAAQIRAGAFETAADAAAHLEGLLAGPMPRFGEVQPD